MRQRQKENFDNRHKAQSPHHLSPGEIIWLPDQGTDRTILQESGPRSYSVQTSSGQYHCNRHHISLPTQSNHRQNPLMTNAIVLPDDRIELPSTKPASSEPVTTGTQT